MPERLAMFDIAEEEVVTLAATIKATV